MTHPLPVGNVSVVGLGKIGAPIAACLASKGYRVIGVDTSSDTVRLINEHRTPIFEPGLEDLIRASRERLTATDDCEEAIIGSDITFIVVPTPSEEHGGFSTRFVVEACERIGEALGKKEGYHLVVLTSTVLPGATDKEVGPVLEARSGKRCGPDFGLCYSPVFMALGSAIRDLLSPDFVLVGESDARAGDLLARVFQSLYGEVPIARMNFVNAELTKLAVSTFVTTKISYANMLARVCEFLPGADVDVVTAAMGLDSRIGHKCLKGALGYGGPCFPRDNLAFSYLASQLKTEVSLVEATDKLNRQQVSRLADLVFSKLRSGGLVAILGLSYKPNTDIVEKSQGLELAHYLLARNVPLILYDPAAMHKARSLVGAGAIFAASAAECVRQADVIVVATAWDEFRDLSTDCLEHTEHRQTLVDCWRILDSRQFEHVADYIALGTGRLSAREPKQ